MKRLVAASLFLIACGTSRDGFVPPPPEFSMTDAGTDAATVCVSSRRRAESVPLAMLVLIDRSGSMDGEKWETATKAVRAFADRAEVVGMKMGLSFFPPVGMKSDGCDPNRYVDLAVPIAPLPENVLPIYDKVTTVQTDGGGTPMRTGLEGSIRAMRDFLAREPAHQGVVILVTDAQPSSCGGVSDVVRVAATGFTPTTDVPSIRTFAVGMEGASFASLDLIAQAGGSRKSFDVGSGAAAQQALLGALEEVRSGVISCEYGLPLPPPGEGVLDLGSVSLAYRPGKNDAATTIQRVDSLDACGATTGHFFYDDPRAPTRIVLCPATCSTVRRGTADASVDLVFGCIKRPR